MRRVCSTQRRRSAEPAKKVRLGYVCSASTSQIRQKDIEGVGGRFPIYGASGMVGYVDSYQLEDEGIGVVKDGAGVGRVMRLPKHSAVIGTILTIRPTGDVDVDYLFYVLCRQNLGSLCTGATIPHLYFKDFKDKTISLPTLAEQKRIAAVLDKICELKKNAETRLEKLDTLVKSRFVEMFEGKGFPTKSWDGVFDATTGKLDSNAATENGIYPFFTCAKLPLRIDCYAFDCEALLLAGNNAAGIYDVKYYKGKFNAYQRTYVLRLKDSNWQYAVFKTQLESKLAMLQSASKGTMTKYLTMGILRTLQFVVPDNSLQREFAAFVEKIDKLRETARQTVKAMDTLYRAKLQEFFG